MMDVIFVQPGRIFARDINEAVLKLREQYGDGRLVIYRAHVQPRKDMVWFEFYIEISK